MALTARVPAGVDAAGFIPEVWSKKYLAAVHNKLVIANRVNRQWEDDLPRQKGDTINVGITNTVTAQEVVVGSVSSTQDPMTGSKVQIVINQWWDAPVVFDEMTYFQSQIQCLEIGTKEATYAIAKKIDTTLATLFSTLNNSTVKGVDGEAITDDLLIECSETLDEADVPEDDRCVIIDPSSKADMLKIDKFIRVDYVRTPVVPQGTFGSLYGMPVLVTNNLVAASTGNYGVMLHRDAIACVIQKNMKMTEFPEPLKHQVTVNAEALWGVKEMRDTFGIPFYTRKI